MDKFWAGVAVTLGVAGMGVWMKVSDGSLKSRKWWGTLGTGLILTSVVMLVIFFFGVQVHFRSPIIFGDEHPQEVSAQHRPISVIGKTFRNERVILDGYLYTNCTFENVTFVYNGGHLEGFLNNTIVVPVKFTSDNLAIREAVGILKGLGYIKPGIDIPPYRDNRIEEPQYKYMDRSKE